MPRLTPLLWSLLAAATAPAQAGPGFSRPVSPCYIITSSFQGFAGWDMRGVHHVKLSNNAPGEWTSAVTVGDLKFYGGNGQSVGIAIGIVRPYLGYVVPTFEAAALNSDLDDEHLTLSPDGLWAVFERSGGTAAENGVWLASRPSLSQLPHTVVPFGAPVKVADLGVSTQAYPALGTVGGRWKVFYTDGASVLMDDIDLARAAVAGSPVIVHAPTPGRPPISPTPIVGADGDVESLLLAEVIAPRSGPFTGETALVWANDLDPSTPAVEIPGASAWQCCGGLAGGMLNFTVDLEPRGYAMRGDVAWLTGDTEAIGGRADIMTGGFLYPPGALVSALFFAAGEAHPIAVPGIGGQFALDLATAVFATSFQTQSLDGTAVFGFPVPNEPVLRGQSVALQALVSDARRNVHTLTNTSWLHIR